MLAEPTAWSVGTLLEAEFELALEEFAQQPGCKYAREELLALHIRQVVQTVKRRRGGIVDIGTEVQASRAQNDLYRWSKYATSTLGGRGSTDNL